jgi:chromosome partitioning protein
MPLKKIIAISNQKGGVAKTTTAVNLAAAFGALGLSTLLVDLDPQGNATMASGVTKRMLSSSVLDIFAGKPLAPCIAKTEYGYDLLPANRDLTRAEDLMREDNDKLSLLKAALRGSTYEWIVIDCPPAVSYLVLSAMVASHAVLVPVQSEYYSLEGVADIIETMKGVRRELNPSLALLGFVRTMCDRTRLSAEVSSDLLQHRREEVLETMIPRSVAAAEAPSFGMPLRFYDHRSKTALAYDELARELIERCELYRSHFERNAS